MLYIYTCRHRTSTSSTDPVKRTLLQRFLILNLPESLQKLDFFVPDAENEDFQQVPTQLQFEEHSTPNQDGVPEDPYQQDAGVPHQVQVEAVLVQESRFKRKRCQHLWFQIQQVSFY